MRKIKKINGYLVVMFNAREHRDWDENGLGNFGVIDAELYTGCLDVDRSVMEYDSAETLKEAVEQARGLNNEEDYSGKPATITIITQSDEGETEDIVDPQLMIAGWTEELTQQVENRNYPDIDPHTAAHELYGYKMALARLGLIDEGEAYVLPNTFGPVTVPTATTNDAHPFDFLHQRPSGASTWRLYELGRALEKDCPENDCIIYRNIFKMAVELDDALDFNSGCARQTLKRQFCEYLRDLERMYRENYAVTTYREQLRAQKECLTVAVTPHKPGDGGILTLPLKSNIPSPKNGDWKLTTCPICGAECWESDLARKTLAAEPDLRATCTACALKEYVRQNNVRT